MAAQDRQARVADGPLSPTATELVLTLASHRQSRPSSPARMFIVAGYRQLDGTDVAIRPGWGGAGIDASREAVDELVALGYLEWVVPPVMISCLDVTEAGMRYAESLIGAEAIGHLSDRSHSPLGHETSSTAG